MNVTRPKPNAAFEAAFGKPEKNEEEEDDVPAAAKHASRLSGSSRKIVDLTVVSPDANEQGGQKFLEVDSPLEVCSDTDHDNVAWTVCVWTPPDGTVMTEDELKAVFDVKVLDTHHIDLEFIWNRVGLRGLAKHIIWDELFGEDKYFIQSAIAKKESQTVEQYGQRGGFMMGVQHVLLPEHALVETIQEVFLYPPTDEYPRTRSVVIVLKGPDSAFKKHKANDHAMSLIGARSRKSA